MRWEMARLQELEASPGVPPHAVHLLQLPVYDMSKRQRRNFAKQTALMADPASPTAPVLVAAMDEHYGNTVLTYDMETLRVRQRLLGHLYDIWDIAVPPPSWQGAPLFATTSWTGDVKVGGMKVLRPGLSNYSGTNAAKQLGWCLETVRPALLGAVSPGNICFVVGARPQTLEWFSMHHVKSWLSVCSA